MGSKESNQTNKQTKKKGNFFIGWKSLIISFKWLDIELFCLQRHFWTEQFGPNTNRV